MPKNQRLEELRERETNGTLTDEERQELETLSQPPVKDEDNR